MPDTPQSRETSARGQIWLCGLFLLEKNWLLPQPHPGLPFLLLVQRLQGFQGALQLIREDGSAFQNKDSSSTAAAQQALPSQLGGGGGGDVLFRRTGFSVYHRELPSCVAPLAWSYPLRTRWGQEVVGTGVPSVPGQLMNFLILWVGRKQCQLWRYEQKSHLALMLYDAGKKSCHILTHLKTKPEHQTTKPET